VGKGLIDGSSVEVDFRDDALYASYTQSLAGKIRLRFRAVDP
jgi:hypothetical protein